MQVQVIISLLQPNGTKDQQENQWSYVRKGVINFICCSIIFLTYLASALAHKMEGMSDKPLPKRTCFTIYFFFYIHLYF